jgi:hypothetical protein
MRDAQVNMVFGVLLLRRKYTAPVIECVPESNLMFLIRILEK